jgi:hypothetical protein
LDVQRLAPSDVARADECARLMAASEPWITLRRSAESASAVIRDPAKEVHVVIDELLLRKERGSWVNFRRAERGPT